MYYKFNYFYASGCNLYIKRLGFEVLGSKTRFLQVLTDECSLKRENLAQARVRQNLPRAFHLASLGTCSSEIHPYNTFL